MSSSAAERYRLSFSVGGLFLRGAEEAARLRQELGSWAAARSAINDANLLQARTTASAKRVGRELIQRLEELTDAELQIVAESTADERAHLMWVAACRRYYLLAEFAEEVLRERFLLMAPDVTAEHFDAFVRGKAIWHPELTEIEESTLRKLRTNLFLMMREADFVTSDGLITPAVLTVRVREELMKRSPSDVRFFATREAA
jgi:hypothetical protein